MFWTIFLISLAYLAIAIILIFIGLYLTHRWTSNCIIRKSAKKTKAAEPVDLTGLNFDRLSDAEFEAKVAELKGEMEGKGTG